MFQNTKISSRLIYSLNFRTTYRSDQSSIYRTIAEQHKYLIKVYTDLELTVDSENLVLSCAILYFEKILGGIRQTPFMYSIRTGYVFTHSSPSTHVLSICGAPPMFPALSQHFPVLSGAF